MPKQKYICANLVYNSPQCGDIYSRLWLDNQLKSLLDRTNLPALRDRYDLEYVIFSDDETLHGISRHPNFIALGNVAAITVIKLGWPADADRFGSRYGLLTQMIQQMMQAVFDPADTSRRNAWVSCLVADLVFAKHSLPKMLQRLEDGHDAVFNVPIRAAADSTNHILAGLPGAPSDTELFELAFRNLHHLWTAATWDSPYFSKFPYSMLWRSQTGLLAHNFSVTPIVFKPNEAMRDVRGGIDTDLPGMCRNPYWATDWTDAAVAGIEPLSNGHYPPFLIQRASEAFVCDWAKTATTAGQHKHLPHPLYYPSRAVFNAPAIATEAQAIATRIQSALTPKD